MKTLITLIFCILLSGYAIAQNNTVNVNFEVDGVQSVYTNATVKFIFNKDTISSKIESGQLIIPSSIVNKKSKVVFYIDRYVLNFDAIPVTLNTVYPKWTIGVDKKPFNKKKFWMIKSWKKVQVVYYLKNADGRIFTVDNYKKSAVIKDK